MILYQFIMESIDALFDHHVVNDDVPDAPGVCGGVQLVQDGLGRVLPVSQNLLIELLI